MSREEGKQPPLVNSVLVCEIDERQFSNQRRASVVEEDKPNGPPNEFHNTLLDPRRRLRGVVKLCVNALDHVAPPGIELFTLPDVSLSLDAALRPRMHSFVLTSGAGKRAYGYCYTHWRAVTPSQLAFVCGQIVAQAVKMSQLRPAISSSSRHLPSEIFAPRAICIVTEFPFHNCFTEYLQSFCEQHQVHSKDQSGLELLLQQLRDQLNGFRVETVPQLGDLHEAMEVLVVPTACGEFRFPGMTTSRKAPPVCDLDFPGLFRLLSVTSIVKVISAVLNEASIFFVSRHPCNLTPAIEAILALIYPFKWPFAYVPLLPFSLRDYLQVPQPFLIGASPELRQYVPAHAFIVDLDANSVTRPESFKKPSLPPSCQRRIAKAVLDFIETLSLPRYPVMSLKQWQHIQQEEHKTEAANTTSLSTQVLLDSESAFDFDIINTQDVNECCSPPPGGKDQSLDEEFDSVNAKLIRAHMHFANLLGSSPSTPQPVTIHVADDSNEKSLASPGSEPTIVTVSSPAVAALPESATAPDTPATPSTQDQAASESLRIELPTNLEILNIELPTNSEPLNVELPTNLEPLNAELSITQEETTPNGSLESLEVDTAHFHVPCRLLSVSRSLSVKLEDPDPPATHGLPRSFTDMNLSRVKMAPSMLSRSRVTFTLRSRFMDVFCSLMKGYLLYLPHGSQSLFDYEGFLRVISPAYRDYMSKFVETHIFGAFVEERSRNCVDNWFDMRIREVLQVTVLRSGLEARSDLKGMLLIQEKSLLASEWCQYSFSLHQSVFSWSRVVARKSPQNTGVTKLGRLQLPDGLVQMTIPAVQGPTAYPLTLNIFQDPSWKVLDSTQTFFFESEAIRRRFIRYVLARTSTASQRTLQAFLVGDPSSPRASARAEPVS